MYNGSDYLNVVNETALGYLRDLLTLVNQSSFRLTTIGSIQNYFPGGTPTGKCIDGGYYITTVQQTTMAQTTAIQITQQQTTMYNLFTNVSLAPQLLPNLLLCICVLFSFKFSF